MHPSYTMDTNYQIAADDAMNTNYQIAADDAMNTNYQIAADDAMNTNYQIAAVDTYVPCYAMDTKKILFKNYFCDGRSQFN